MKVFSFFFIKKNEKKALLFEKRSKNFIQFMARVARRLIRRAARVAATQPRPMPAPDVPPPPMDPNAPYIFRPSPVPEDVPAVVTLDELYKLSRSL